MRKNFYALVPVPVRIEILNPDAPEEEQTGERIPEPQFPTVSACFYYEQTIDLRLCEKDEKILFGMRIDQKEWPIWAKAHQKKKVEVFPNWARVLAEYRSNIRGKLRQVPCHKGGAKRWLPKDQLGDWVEDGEPPRIGSILGVKDF